MSSKLNVESFVTVLKKSGLIEADRLQRLVTEFTQQGGSPDDSVKLAEFLIAGNVLTRWQAEKLLQGKHKGYFLGKYRLLSLLGKGGMSSVYLAEHVLMRRRCALKVLPTKRVNDSSYLGRFHREAQAVASLDHPNIVRAYDVDHQSDRDTDIHFLVMEYVEGMSLQELVQKEGVTGFFDATEYIRQAALGLEHAHEAGMVHRDIKPGNLLVDPNGVVKVLDLGLARFFSDSDDKESLTVAHDEKVLGTADYLAPEQALDSHTVDARADIYSLGCTFYFLLAGRPPFTEGTLAQRLMAHQAKTPPAIESLRTDTPPTLAAIIRKMMAKKPDDRYATARDTADALFAWLDANADSAWRAGHSAIFGPRSSEPSANQANIPVARPVLAMPVAQPAATQAPVQFEPPPQFTPAPQFAPQAQFTPPPPAPVAADPTPAVNTELSSFFASLSDSQNIAAQKSSPKQKSGPKSAPKQPRPAFPPAPVQETPNPAVAMPSAVPANLNPAPSPTFEIPAVAPAEPVAPTGFPDFSAMSAATPLPTAPVATPAAPRRAPQPKPSSKPKFKLPFKGPFKRPPVPILAGAGGSVVVLLLIVAYVLGWFGSGGAGGGGRGGRTSKEVLAKLPPWPESKREITVGETGEYKTIVDALIAVRYRFEPTGNPDDIMVIKVAPGTYTENISVDGTIKQTRRRGKKSEEPTEPNWPRGITLKADGEVVLEASSDGPVVRLKNIPRFSMEGIEIRAAKKPVAVEVSGDLTESHLSGMKISGFTQAGVSCLGARGISFGNSQFVLEKLRIEPAAGSSSAIGIRMQHGEDADPSDGIIRACQLIGPMAAGLSISGTGPVRITIAGNIFSGAQDGIRFEGQVKWEDIVVVNNTFHDGRLGIVFTKMPAEGSNGLVFRRNLFSKVSVAEGLVQSDYNEGKLGSMLAGMEFNYSDRAKPATAGSGEMNRLFDQNGKQGEQGFAFASTDPKNAKFLAPTDKSVQKNVPGAKEGEKGWVGAVGP